MIRWVLLSLILATPVLAQTRAVVDGAASTIEVDDDEAQITLVLSEPVPWRVGLREAPWRLVIDLSEGDFTELRPVASDLGLLWGRLGPETTRLVIPLPAPMGVADAVMDTRGGTTIRIALDEDIPPVVEAEAIAAPVPSMQAAPDPDRPLIVALDPGHGGIDPGAERGGVKEADLMLRFARELTIELERAGHSVVLTREDDTLVSLRGRASVAREAGADLMISLHADAVRGGGASGATAYTLKPEDGDEITAELAERQARGDLLMGVELENEGDEIARVLVDLARTETGPRAEALAGTLIQSLGQAGLRLHKRPRLGADFTVLKTPDIPTVLLELGFMSDARDLENLLSRDWRARTAVAVARAVTIWGETDRSRAPQRRR